MASFSQGVRAAPGGAEMVREGDRLVVRMWGEHDVCTTESLDSTLTTAVTLGQGEMVVDLAAVEFMDCSALRPLLRCRQVLAESSRGLAVRSPPLCARRLFDVCRMAGLLDPFSVVDGPHAGAALATWVEVPSEPAPETPGAGPDAGLARRDEAASTG